MENLSDISDAIIELQVKRADTIVSIKKAEKENNIEKRDNLNIFLTAVEETIKDLELKKIGYS